jgi:hypothetical protein
LLQTLAAQRRYLKAKKQLEDNGVDLKVFGKGEAKTVEQLAGEVHSGASLLMLDASTHKKIVRVVDTVALRVVAPEGPEKKRYLIEIEEMFIDQRGRKTHRLPGTKKNPHENTKQAAERIVQDYLGKVAECKLQFEYGSSEVFETETGSPSFPGVQTVYRKEIVEVKILKASPGIPSGFFQTGSEWKHQDNILKNTRTFRWMEPQQCDADGIQYKIPADWSYSALVHAPVGLNEEDLVNFLQKHKIDTTRYGVGQAKTLQEFSAELLKGDASLTTNNFGKPIRVVEPVLLKLIDERNGSVLVQAEQTYPSGETVKLNRLPGTKRRPDESHFLSARRIVQRHLKIDPNQVMIEADTVQEFDETKESAAFPGLLTLYRKRIVTANLEKVSQ